MGFIVVAAVIMVLGLLYALRAVFLVCQGTEDKTAFFDQVLLSVPMVALSECARQAEAMLETARKSLETALGLFQQYRPEAAQAVREKQWELDRYEEKLSGYLAKIPSCDLSEEDVLNRVKLDLTIGSIQALGSCAVKLEKLAARGAALGLSLSEEDQRDLLVVSEAMGELIRLLAEAYHTNEREKFPQIQALKKVISSLLLQLKTSVVVCLKNSTISADACYLLSCVYMDCEDVLEIAQMIQSGVERTAFSRQKKISLNEKLDRGEADQTALAQYAIKYSI